MADETIKRVRRFNRVVTERIGALNDRYLERDRAVGQARVLWEIGPDGIALAPLRARLGLDSGYLSRLLRSLQADGLVKVIEDPLDRRARRTADPLAASVSTQRSMPGPMSSSARYWDP